MPSSAQLLQDLRHLGSLDLEVLTDAKQSLFQHHARRWSDQDRQTPAAIVLPETERQIQETVQWALQYSVPFVVKSGGHSNWSTIGSDGVVIDLSRYSGIDVQVSDKTAKLRGSIVSKKVAVRLAETGHFTALGNSNEMGAIPYFLNGGASLTTSLTGYGSDQIIAARIIDARGRLVEVTEEKTADLLYAIRGAGQFFGLITELTIRIWPLSSLGNEPGALCLGRFVYPLDRAREVAVVMQDVVNDSSKATAGLLMIVLSPPPTRKPTVVVSIRVRGEAKSALEPLYGLGPLTTNEAYLPIQHLCDGREALESMGGFKTFATVGLGCFDVERFLKTVDVWKRLMEECPDAANTTFNFQWDSRPPRRPEFESANCLHDVQFWQNNIIWHLLPESSQRVAELNDECIAIARDGSDLIDFSNATRSGPLERRFKGEARLEKLKALKREWDEGGVFTRQFLD